MRIAIAQLNPTVGDFDGNLTAAKQAIELVRDREPALIVFSELFLTGYPPQDLLEKNWFVTRALSALDELREFSRGVPDIGILVGTISPNALTAGKGLYNSAVLLKAGEILTTAHKMLLPTYDVFDEARYFDGAKDTSVIPLGDEVLGISICEDAWNDPALWHGPAYDFDPLERQVTAGATVLVNLSASPFGVGKDAIRHELFSGHARKHGVPIVLVNQVGGNDELIFDGNSMCVSREGLLLARMPAFEETVSVVDTSQPEGASFVPGDAAATIYEALVLGLRDYVRKCNFKSVAVGLSGGIDSALVCAVAAEALGSANVVGVTMPSVYSSPGSVDDSVALAANLGVRIETVPIGRIHDSYLDTLSRLFPCNEVDVTVENIQARIRGNILMALSNREGHLVLSTGNKSELAVGYCTLYGDMSGGLAVISDVPKTMVYELARHVNRDRELIPAATIEKPPSAELRPGQKDQDTLPPYETLDRILALYIDENMAPADIVMEGFDAETVRWIIAAVNGNEYKRRQAAPGLKVTSKAFGTGRRMPMAARHES
ncbi:MAG: NAD+ synthase [Candidatus Eisenbacteria bacterium]|nr:NAD+ synthase [Candidatus Eisenbacteria bacterium]